MIHYPLTFAADTNSGPGTMAPWQVSASGNESLCAIPTEFGGAGGAPSPEDLFLLALSNCFVATFKVYAQASQIVFESIQVRSQLTLDRNSNNQPIANSCEFQVHVGGVSNPGRALTVLQKVSRSGILLNSVKTDLHFQFFVNGERAQ